MTTLAEVIRRKYAKHLIEFSGATSHIECDVALFALMTALEDLEEVWQDEYANLERRVERGQEELASQVAELMRRQGTIETLRAGLQQVKIENDALEAECLRLRVMNGSLSAMSAETGSPEPGALSTSRPMGRIRPSPGGSSSESDAAAGRASSAGTSKRRKEKMKSENGELQAQEVGERTGLDPTPAPAPLGRPTLTPIDWPYRLADVLPTNAPRRWKSLGKLVQERLIYRIAETINAQFGTISQSLYDSYKPAWTTSVASWSKTTNLKWIDVLNHLRIVPSNLPLALRSVRTATN